MAMLQKAVKRKNACYANAMAYGQSKTIAVVPDFNQLV
jgi:hypothetical protein